MSFDPDAGDSSFTSQTTSKNYGAFYREWIRNNFKSKAEGREVGEYHDFILIISPGQTKTEVRTKVTEEHKKEFPEQWKAYQEGKEQISTGTPIEMLPGLERNRALSLKAMYIMTIEQMAQCSDIGLQKVGMGSRELKDRAIKYLEGTKGAEALLAKAYSTVAQLQAENMEMKRQYDEVLTRLAVLEAPKPEKKARGWPKGKPRKSQVAHA